MKTFGVLLLVLAGIANVTAQTRPVPAVDDDSSQHTSEVFGGYSYTSADSPGPGSDRVNLNGWSGEIAVIQNEWLSYIGNISGHYGSTDFFGTDVKRSVHYFLAGARVRTERFRRIVPFAHGLVGVNRSHIETSLAEDSDTGFSLAFGAGADLSLNESWSVRMIQADWIGTGLGDDNLNNARLSFGVVYKFGER
jgi:opacity protein-like surface antigen